MSLESPPFAPHLQKASWIPLQEKLMRLIPYHSHPTVSKLGQSKTLHDVLEHDDSSGVLWRVRHESTTLKNHFPSPDESIAPCPIVPLTSLVSFLTLKRNNLSLRCKVQKPLLPGDIIALGSNGIDLVKPTGEKGENILEILPLESRDPKLGQDCTITPDMDMQSIKNFSLPQGDQFKFVTSVARTGGYEYFGGSYRTPVHWTDIRHEPLPHFDLGLLPEIVAQTGAAVGCSLLPTGHIYVYEGGVFNFAPDIDIMQGETLRTSAQIINNESDKISYLFCLRRSRDNEAIFWGQVDAKSIEYSQFVRGINIMARRRARK